MHGARSSASARLTIRSDRCRCQTPQKTRSCQLHCYQIPLSTQPEASSIAIPQRREHWALVQPDHPVLRSHQYTSHALRLAWRAGCAGPMHPVGPSSGLRAPSSQQACACFGRHRAAAIPRCSPKALIPTALRLDVPKLALVDVQLPEDRGETITPSMPLSGSIKRQAGSYACDARGRSTSRAFATQHVSPNRRSLDACRSIH